MAGNIPALAVPDDAPTLETHDQIVAFVNDDLSAAALRTGLEGGNLEVKRGTIMTATKWLEKNTELLAVIVDISGIDDPVSGLEDLSRLCPPDVKVALIGDSTDMGFYRTVVNEMGASEYLAKPLTRDAVQTILRPKLVGKKNNDSEINRGGHVIAMCGAQGGAGTTTIAVNLALLLAETTKAKVAILDLHLQGGETTVMLGVRPGPGLRIALEDHMRADTLFIERAAIDINDKVKLIAADEALNAELQITEAGIRHVIGLLRSRFNYIVVDVPVPLAPAIHPVISLSRHVLVLLESEITGLRNAVALRAAVTEIAGKNRVFTVLNRANRPGGLPTPTIIEGLGSKPDMLIPDLGKGMTQAVNTGVPALRHVRALRRHLAPIVREICGISTKKHGVLGRLLGR